MGCCKSVPSSQHPQEENDGKKGRTIYVENLPAKISRSRLRRAFKKFGKIPSGKIRIVVQGVNAYAFIEFEARSSVAKAIKASPLLVDGRRVFIEEKWWLSDRGRPPPNSLHDALNTPSN